MYIYELFKLKSDDIARLKASDAAEDLRVLGQWYIFTAPVEDYEAQAESCFRRAIEKGDIEAKLHLANMYRLGDMGHVDFVEYQRLLNEAVEEGCQLAEMRVCKDIAYGIGQDADIDNAIEEAKRRMSSHEHPDPRWYDTIGWMYKDKDDEKEANDWFFKAIDSGFIDSYVGLSDMPEMQKEGSEAGCGGCFIFLAEELKKKYDYCVDNDALAVEYFSTRHEKQAFLDANHKHCAELGEQIEECYEEAGKLGYAEAYYYLGMIYYDAMYERLEDDKKAWNYFMRGNQLGETCCMVMLAEMIKEGRGGNGYGWKEACMFRLKALRFGFDDMLLPVMRAYFGGDLDEYADEIETLYMPIYESGDYSKDWPEEEYDGEDFDDDEPEDDDGRWDPYV